MEKTDGFESKFCKCTWNITMHSLCYGRYHNGPTPQDRHWRLGSLSDHKEKFMSAMRWSNVWLKHFTIKSCRIYEHFLLLLRTTFRNIEGLHVSALLIFIWNNKTYKCVDKMPRTELYNVKLPISLLPQVCDMFLKYGLPLVVMPPPGVFYPTLFATDPISVDRLAYIMYRWALFISFV